MRHVLVLNYASVLVLVWIWSLSSYVLSEEEAPPGNSVTFTFKKDIGQKLKRYLGTERRLLHDRLVRWFMEYPPPETSVSSNGTVPVLILLHFGTGNMRSSRLFGRTVEKDPWLLLAK